MANAVTGRILVATINYRCIPIGLVLALCLFVEVVYFGRELRQKRCRVMCVVLIVVRITAVARILHVVR